MAPDELTLETALKYLDAADVPEEPIGVHPDTQKPIYIKHGRFGAYVQMGEPDDEEKQNASILKTIKPEEVDLEIAVKLLSLPRDLGVYEELKEPVMAYDGRYGPYVKCGKESRTLPAELSPLDITFDQAVELLKQPKPRGRGRAAPKEPLKTFDDKSPVTDEIVKILDGRYGPYVTDGTTNASLPKGTDPVEVSFDQALILTEDKIMSSKRLAAVSKLLGETRVPI